MVGCAGCAVLCSQRGDGCEMKALEWHNCNGEIGKHIRFVSEPLKSFNGGKPTWVLLISGPKSLIYMPMNYCPICGEALKLLELNDDEEEVTCTCQKCNQDKPLYAP